MPHERQQGAVLLEQWPGLRSGGQPGARDEDGEPHVLQGRRGLRGERAEGLSARAEPSEEQARDQTAAAGAERQGDVPGVDDDLAEQGAYHDPEPQVDEVRGIVLDHRPDLRDHLLQAVPRPHQGEDVTPVERGLAGGREVLVVADDVGDVDPVLAELGVRTLQGVDGPAVRRLLRHGDLAGGEGSVQPRNGGCLGADLTPRVDDGRPPPHDLDQVTEGEFEAGGGGEELAAPLDALDRDPATERLLQPAHGTPVGERHQVGPAHRAGQRLPFVGLQSGGTAAHPLPELAGGLRQVDAQQHRHDLAGQQHDGDETEEVADRVRGGDVPLVLTDLLGGQAAELPDGLGGRTHDRGLGGGPGEDAGRGADVQVEGLGQPVRDAEHADQLDEAESEVPQAAAVQVGEELRPRHVPQREDEEGEEDRLDVVVDTDVPGAQEQRDDQRAADAAEGDRPDVCLAHQVAEGETEEEGEFGVVAENPHTASASPGKSDDE